jgi:hypothetical protein
VHKLTPWRPHRHPNYSNCRLIDIFQIVIKDLVTEEGVTAAWKLRGTCRVFAKEITHEIFAKQPLDAFDYTIARPATENQAIKTFGEHTFYKTLFWRTKLPHNVDDFLTHIVKSAMHWLAQEVDLGTKDEADDCCEQICKAVVVGIGGSLEAFHALQGKGFHITMRRGIASVLDSPAKMAIAAAIGNFDLVKRYLPTVNPLNECTGSVFPSTILTAVATRQLNLLNLITDHFHENRQKPVNPSCARSSLEASITFAMERSDLSFIDAQVNFGIAFFGRNYYKFKLLLIFAMFSKKAEVVQYVMGLELRDKNLQAEQEVFDILCRHDLPDDAKVLFGPGCLDPNRVFQNKTDLTKACARGIPDMVAAVLDAGGKVDGPVPGMGNFPAPLKPIQVAVGHNAVEVAELLIRRGANLKGVFFARVDNQAYRVVRETKTKQEKNSNQDVHVSERRRVA